VIVLLLSAGVSAAAPELVGGVTRITIGLTDINEEIDTINAELDGEDYSYEDYAEKMDSTTGYFIGLQTSLNNKWKLEGQYERYNLRSNCSYEYSTFDSVLTNTYFQKYWDLGINGLVGTATYQVNDYLALTGAIGDYSALYNEYEYTKEVIYDDSDPEMSSVGISTNITTIEENMSGIGYKAGAVLSYQPREGWYLLGAVNYRMLTLVGMSLDELEFDAGGFEFSGGINCLF